MILHHQIFYSHVLLLRFVSLTHDSPLQFLWSISDKVAVSGAVIACRPLAPKPYMSNSLNPIFFCSLKRLHKNLLGVAKIREKRLNPFLIDVPILHPLKTPAYLWFSDVFRGEQNGNIGLKWVKPKFKSSRNTSEVCLEPYQKHLWWRFCEKVLSG